MLAASNAHALPMRSSAPQPAPFSSFSNQFVGAMNGLAAYWGYGRTYTNGGNCNACGAGNGFVQALSSGGTGHETPKPSESNVTITQELPPLILVDYPPPVPEEKEDCEDPPAEVPEPASLALFGVGLAGLAARARRK